MEIRVFGKYLWKSGKISPILRPKRSETGDIFPEYIASYPCEFPYFPAREESHLARLRDISLDIRVSLEVLPEFLCRFISRIDDGHMRKDRFDVMADNGVVGTSENDGLYIGIESHDMFLDDPCHLGSVVYSLFYERDELRSRYFLDQDGVIMEMHAFLVCPDLYGRFRRKDPYFSISGFEYLLGTGDGHPEDFPVRETNLLEVPYGVSGRGIAGKYDDGRSLVEQELHSFFGVPAYGRILQIPIGTTGAVAEIAVIVFREEVMELSEYGESSKPGIKESDHILIIYVFLDELRHIRIFETFL